MSDFLAAVADHLNREPSMCACGHPSVLHSVEAFGCAGRFEHDSGVDFCPCEAISGSAPAPAPALCACGHRTDDHERYVGCLGPPNWLTTTSDVSCPCEEEG